MYRAANWNAALGRQTRSDAHHLRAIALHWEIAQRSRVRIFADMHVPTKHRMQRAMQHSVVKRGIRPAPKGGEGLLRWRQRVRGDHGRRPIRKAKPAASMPNNTPSPHCLNSSRVGPCVAFVASGGTAPACRAKDK